MAHSTTATSPTVKFGPPRIGIFAPSSPVGLVELDLGVQQIRDEEFDVFVHPQTTARDFLSAGTDHQRAAALLDLANDDSIDVVWAARGGWGAARMLPLLAAAPIPARRKTLVGYSDVTALHEFVRQVWGWQTLHAVVPASRLQAVSTEQWQATIQSVRTIQTAITTQPSQHKQHQLRWLIPPDHDTQDHQIRAELIGGNLTLMTTLVGTPWQPSGRAKILFFEDVHEKLYRIERYVTQLEQAGMFEGAAAVVLGDFTHCDDEANVMLAPITDKTTFNWQTHPQVPQRNTFSLDEGLTRIFSQACAGRKVPLAIGLPVGHGPNFWPLELGCVYQLTRSGLLIQQER